MLKCYLQKKKKKNNNNVLQLTCYLFTYCNKKKKQGEHCLSVLTS